MISAVLGLILPKPVAVLRLLQSRQLALTSRTTLLEPPRNCSYPSLLDQLTSKVERAALF